MPRLRRAPAEARRQRSTAIAIRSSVHSSFSVSAVRIKAPAMAAVVITLCGGDGCGQLPGSGNRPFLDHSSGFRTESEFAQAGHDQAFVVKKSPRACIILSPFTAVAEP